MSQKPLPFHLLLGCIALALAMMCATPLHAECDPAVIDSVITNGPLCPGDHIDLSVVAHGDILGYSWEGPGTGTFFSFTPEYSFNFQILGEYTIIVYGDCGNDTATVVMNAQGAGAGHDDTLHICDNGPTKSLEVSLGSHAEGGAWVYNEFPHSGIYDPLVDTPGDYVYTSPDSATCPGTSQTATVTVTETYVGPDTAWTTCSMDGPFPLEDLLEPGTTPGGDWKRIVFISLVPHSGTYDPTVDSSGVFRYTVGGCSASINVTEDPALPWFRDDDNDSLGDPLEMEWDCEQPLGYVADSTDNCIELPGRIGSACDDGRPETVDDMVTDSCTCSGLLPTRITEAIAPARSLHIWPNPNRGDRVFLDAVGSGPATLDLFDALGRTVFHRELELTGSSQPLAMDLPTSLSQGIYSMRLWANERVSTARLTIQ